jgi:L-seryl-tRNA(Ser) seleniumtransferase
MVEAAAYSNLEIDLADGERGSRQDHVSAQITALTGAEAAHVTVNAAAAVLLSLAAIAKGREVIVSRGQSVEIGGGFRVPVILRQSGAKLVEVGTTNRTRLSDYEEAISPRTAAILHVHSSNFRIMGFTESVPLPDLATLAREHDLPLIADNGSGALLDTVQFGLTHEPTVQESVADGCDLVAFSGDKLLGGPQAGILVGRRDLVSMLSRHPLARALRPDKVILAALSATFAAYLKDDAIRTLPVWQMISQTQDQLETRSRAWAERSARQGVTVEVVGGNSTVGGGSLPTETLPTVLIKLPAAVSAADLRDGQPPVLARARLGRVLLDLRTVPTSQEEELSQAVLAAWTVAKGIRGRVNDSAHR